MKQTIFENRDLSWLSFNRQVLNEALDQTVPIRERINFLAIFSSNLDEFYRVRFPVVQLLAKSMVETLEGIDSDGIFDRVCKEIALQQNLMGKIIKVIRKELLQEGIVWVYQQKIPKSVYEEVSNYFLKNVLGKIQLISSNSDKEIDAFAPNSIVFLVFVHPDLNGEKVFIPLPTPSIPRFLSFRKENKTYIIFLEDLIKNELVKYRPELLGFSVFSFKVNRNAEMDLKEEVVSNISKKIRKEVKRREFGSPTRLLFERGMPLGLLDEIKIGFHLDDVNLVEGGHYHQLKDLFGFPIENSQLSQWEVREPKLGNGLYFLEEILSRDFLIHTPYHSFQPVLRIFNEAALHPDIVEIHLTIYRVAKDSQILNALITAARNGKRVTVFVELKARFDEENNLDWSERLRAAGITIKYSIPKLKVHAKVALFKFNDARNFQQIALLGTGNFNESTAKIYTDHFLFTADQKIGTELDLLFKILKRNLKKDRKKISFSKLWVGKFNLKNRILELIEEETKEAEKGNPAEIFLKMNNLEEEKVILALYRASQAGVKIRLLVRGLCRLIPGVVGLSEGITVKRIVDHYLEHGRIFSFFSKGEHIMYLGSADWMDRNLNRRIEVCFPILDLEMKSQLAGMLELQWADNQKSICFPKGNLKSEDVPRRSQLEILGLIKKN